jgi:hypothetical protein
MAEVAVFLKDLCGERAESAALSGWQIADHRERALARNVRQSLQQRHDAARVIGQRSPK